VASITQDENRRRGSIGSGRDLSSSDMTRRERGGSRCERMRQWCTCQSTMCAFRTPCALLRRCLSPNHPRRMAGDRVSSHAPTCFRGHHRRVDPRHAGPADTGFRLTMLAPRTKRDATCQPSSVKNLHSHSNTISRKRLKSQPNFSMRLIPLTLSILLHARSKPILNRGGQRRPTWRDYYR